MIKQSLLAVVLVAGLGSTTAHATTVTYSAADDFSLASNPNGAWAYGSTVTLGSFSINPTPVSNAGSDSTLQAWSGGAAGVFYNPNPLDTYYYESGIRFQGKSVGMHPGVNGEYAVIRFTAPTTSVYDLNAYFGGMDMTPTTTDVHVLHNGTQLYAGNINGFEGFDDGCTYLGGWFGSICSNAPASGSSPSVAYNNSALALNAGDTLDFAVGWGSNGNYFSDSTRAVITLTTAVPEPETYAMLLAGLGLVGAVARWRNA